MAGGSGVVYRIDDDNVYIITNFHVVYDRSSNNTTNFMAKKIEVYPYGFEYADYTVEAEFVGGSISKDIAVVKASYADFPCAVKAAVCGDSHTIALGEQVVAIGNPGGDGIAVTSGVVSVDSEEIEMESLESASQSVVMRVLRTDTAINPGNSGGGLYNLDGELVGIVNAKTIESGVENVGYAIPISVAAGIADRVLSGEGDKCVLGITIKVNSIVTQYDAQRDRVEIIERIVIESVAENALASGKLQAGDELVAFLPNDGEAQPITRSFHLPDYLYSIQHGEAFSLTVLRGGTQTVVELSADAAFFAAL